MKKLNKKQRTITAYVIWVISFVIAYYLITKFFLISPSNFPFFIREMPFDWGYHEYMFSAKLLGIPAILIVIRSFFLIKKEKNPNSKIRLSIYSLIIASVLHISFFLFNLKYVFEEYPKVFLYTSLNGEYITNNDRYFKLIEKYGFGGNSYAKYEKIEDNIEALEFAKQTGNVSLYYAAFRGIGDFGYDKAFKTYNDITFQAFFLKYLLYDNDFFDKYIFKLEEYKEQLSNNLIIEAMNYISNEYKNNFDPGNRYFSSELRDSAYEILRNIKEINGEIVNFKN